MSVRELPVRLLGSILLAYCLVIATWVVWGIFTTGDWFGNGSHLVEPSLLAALAAGLVGGFWISNRPRRLVPLAGATGAVLCFQLFAPNGGWWVKGDPNGLAAIGDLRTLVEAERLYRAVAGAYGPVECLVETARCVPGYTGSSLLFMSVLGEKQGYTRTFHAGPSASSGGGRPPGFAAYAAVAVPVRWGKTGDRIFCADSGGGVYALGDRQPPEMGPRPACAPPWKLIVPPSTPP